MTRHTTVFYPALLWLLVLLSGCTALPPQEDRSVSHALPADMVADTRLGLALQPELHRHPGQSGIYPLADGPEAFAARLLLAQVAERSLDVQYYIWRRDLSGYLLFRELVDAADRGVRIRLLLDDHGSYGLDTTLAYLNAHPNIEIRLFNPFVIRRTRLLEFVTDFSRVNRRMHNKSFTADNLVTLIGGRNIGDEYFGAHDGMQFADLDVLAVGPVVADVSEDFDRYWASLSAYPAERILRQNSDHSAAQARLADLDQHPQTQAYLQTLQHTALISRLLNNQLELEWAYTRMVSDDPAKGLGLAPPEALLPHQLMEIIGIPDTDVELISPYFVPTAAGVEAFADLAQRGIEIRILTNSLESTDVLPVHAGYAKRRKALLQAGIRLYEMKRLSNEARQQKFAGPFGSSGSSLHAKTFAVDRQRVFVGSFNFDPRSTNLNTELGFVIESPTLASQIEESFNTDIPQSSYEVRLNADARLYWLERSNGELIYHYTEPGSRLRQRAAVWFLSLLPIEWLL